MTDASANLPPIPREAAELAGPAAPGLTKLVAMLEKLVAEGIVLQRGAPLPETAVSSAELTQEAIKVLSSELASIYTDPRVRDFDLLRAEAHGEDSAAIGMLFERLSYLFGQLAELSQEGKPVSLLTPFTPDAISFINARPALAAMRAMWAGREHWHRPEDGQPYFTDKNGVTVYAQEGAQFNQLALDAAWQRVLSLDDSKVNTFLICLGKWMADTGGGAGGLTKTRVHVADILSFRGLKKEPHGGYKRTQKDEAKQDILALNSIWIRSIEKVYIGRGKSENRAIDSRLLEVAIESNPDLYGGFEPFAFRIAPGDWAMHFLGEHNRQVATLLRPVMKYDPDKQRIPMRLGIYLATQWRNRAKDESYEQAWRASSMLNGAFISLPTKNLDRFRQQFEQALDRLQADNVIAGWEYEGDTDLPVRKWFGLWLDWKVKIVPAGAALEPYENIAPRRRALIARGKRASKAATARKTSA